MKPSVDEISAFTPFPSISIFYLAYPPERPQLNDHKSHKNQLYIIEAVGGGEDISPITPYPRNAIAELYFE